MEQIRYAAGTFLEFTATRTFDLSTLNVKVQKGTPVEFDGSTVKYAGASYQLPQLRSAVSAGWLVPTAEYDEANPTYGAPASANMKMRPTTDQKRTAAQTVATTVVEADERTVMSSKTHAAATRDQNRGTVRKVAASTGGAELQEGVPVRALKTSAKAPRAELSSAAIQDANNVQIDPGKGISEEEMLARMTPEDQAIYLAKKESLRSRYVDTAPTVVQVVKTAGTKEAEGMKLTQQVGGGVEIADMSGSTGQPKVSTRVEDGITFKNTNGPERNKPEPSPRATQPVMVLDGTAEVRLQIARTLCPEFPQTYDFAAPARNKLARLLADFEDRPDVIRAVFAAESDDFKAKLVAEFPQVFQG
jgi:peptidyl-tRNA hydrolase